MVPSHLPESELPESPLSPRARPAGRGPGVLLFAGAIFASAFLIFLVQPMVGKRILPWFGGVPAVWTLCLAFYQSALFAGYAYAHFLVRALPPAGQLALHALAVGAALLVLPVLPGEAWKPEGGSPPAPAILAMLGAHVALPFLVLAATGPLVQAWFARSHPGRSPYPLYAVSNLGSLLALLGYPFLIEPRLTLSATGSLWSWAFLAAGIAVLACGALTWWREPRSEPAADAQTTPIPAARVALWLGLSGCGVVLLMGITNQLFLDVASVPFLWVLPLAAYLVSLILCFGFERSHRRGAYVVLCGLALAGIALGPAAARAGGIAGLVARIQVQIALHCILLFGACMALHGELYRLRPAPRSLTAYYLCVSGGGALGGVLVGIAAPQILDGYTELPIGLALAWLLLLAAGRDDPRGWLHPAAPRWRRAAVLVLTALMLGHGAVRTFDRRDDLVHQERSFFGVLRVLERGEGANRQFHLLNGTTLHGIQIPKARRQPTSYFGVQTGIGLAMEQREPGVDQAVGVVGLGVGTLAAYGRAGDRFRFYEIDPAVIRLARDAGHFSFLRDSRASVEVAEGDGRISLAAERARGAPRFDLLVIDAFSSDAVPVHLLTREAVALYADRLEEDGLLAFHASNRYFFLLPLLSRSGASAGLDVVGVRTPALPRHLSEQTSWVFLSRDPERLRSLAALVEERQRQLGLPRAAMNARRTAPATLARVPLWTDDYSDLLGALVPLGAR